ncbi:MAG TPA: LysR family transcriptional regulator [Polyangiaceae bacterium]|nr:LysR family transcriptional regulator [Polyangiaceae bacterium]
MRYTLRQLEVFLAVARHESVSRAAKDLAMSQSAVSGSLNDLEQAFDVRLFERVGKRLRLNDLGRAFRPHAEALWDQARELENVIENRAGATPLRVGATLSIGNYLMAPLLARFRREEPAIRVGLEVFNTEEIVRRVHNFEIDIGLVEGEVQGQDLRVTRWCDDELYVFCAPWHPLAKKRALDEEDLKKAAWIVRERGSGTRQAFEHAMHGLLPELDISLELQHTEAIKSAVKAGLGVGCVSRVALVDELEFGSLVRCRVPGRDFRRAFYFVLHQDKFQGPALKSWLNFCVRSVKGAPKARA